MTRHRHDHRVLVGRHAAAFDVLSGWTLGWLYGTVAGRVVGDLPAGGRVLDVGGGPGRLLGAVAGRRPDARLLGVDPSPDMVDRAGRALAALGLADRAETTVAAAEALPLPDRSVDVAVSTLSAHHWSDVDVAVREQARVLSDGGALWVFDLRRSSASVQKGLNSAMAGARVERGRLPGLRGAVISWHRVVRQGSALTQPGPADSLCP